ncbi:MAG: type II toxin-antitoxin system RelE/ParE family toxin [Geminicoccaceae bacterium]
MSIDYVLAPAALADIDEIADFLSAADPEAALKAVDAIYGGCEFLADRPDLTRHDVFFWGVARRYSIVYRKTEPLQIVRVLAWRRDIERVLRDELGPRHG